MKSIQAHHLCTQPPAGCPADLTSLVYAVICAGIKSVLDIPRTLEFLETQGVCVAALGAGELMLFPCMSIAFLPRGFAAASIQQ